MNYKNYIKGKRVCFVGGCPNIQGMGTGVDIDNYDVVVKTNGSLYLKGDEYYRDYGKRIDVLYTNNQFYREMSPDIVDMKNVKYLRMKTCSHNDLVMYNKEIPAERITEAITKVDKNIHGALMGCYIFQDILNQNPAELHITGMDFFISKNAAFKHDNYQEYIKGYLPDKIRNQGNKINIGKTKDGHNMLHNTMYMYNLYKESGKITMPDFIEEIMYGIVEGRLKQHD